MIGWMSGLWMDDWMDGWMNGWMDGLNYERVDTQAIR